MPKWISLLLFSRIQFKPCKLIQFFARTTLATFVATCVRIDMKTTVLATFGIAVTVGIMFSGVFGTSDGTFFTVSAIALAPAAWNLFLNCARDLATAVRAPR